MKYIYEDIYEVLNNYLCILLKHYILTLGCDINRSLATGLSSESLRRTVKGSLFSLNAVKLTESCSPDFVTGIKFPANSRYIGFPSKTLKKKLD